jgi:glyoxylase-like metal-dependent hydrolase (beta-lactamase superfamily II)
MSMNKLGLFIGACALSLHAFADEETQLSFASQEVAPGLYMLSGVGGFTGGNIGLSVGRDGVVMIDDSMPPMLDIMKEAVQGVTTAPVDFLINTHLHGDHIGNNASLSALGAHIVAHDNLRKRLLDPDREGGPAADAALPVLTFSKDMHFHLNGEDAYVFHVPRAHTDGDLVIHFTGANVIHTGDVMFNGMFPFIDIENGGSVTGYIAAQEAVLALADAQTRIMPGHGSLASKKDLERDLAMLKDAHAQIGQLLAAGKSEDEVVALNPLQKYDADYSWSFFDTQKMTRQVYKGLQTEQGAE